MPKIPIHLLGLLGVAACGSPSGNDPFGEGSATVSTMQPGTATMVTSETTADPPATTSGGAT